MWFCELLTHTLMLKNRSYYSGRLLCTELYV